MGDCKKITATAKGMVVNVRDGAKTAVSAFKEISTNLKTVSLATKVPLKCFEVELKGLGEGDIPDPSLFRYNEDNAQALEVLSKLFERPIAELSAATEVLSINATKVLTDFQAASDNLLLVVDWVREIDDGLQNQFVNNDILLTNFSKILSEQSFVIDTVAKSVATSRLDSNFVTDIITSTFQAPKQDTLTTSDSLILLVDFRPLIQDWVYSTDDVLGNANIDDDQYMLFNKVVIDSSALSEKLAATLSTIVLGNAVGGIGDSYSVNDVFEKSLSVVLDNSDYFLQEYVHDSYLLTGPWIHDTTTFGFNKQISDTGTTADIVIREASFYRSFADTPTSADTALISISKELNDDIASIDAIVKSAGVSLTDSVEVPDVLGKSLATSKVDAAGMSDACTVNLQNYMSALYVNAGYIGVNYAL